MTQHMKCNALLNKFTTLILFKYQLKLKILLFRESCFYKVKDITHCCDDYEYDKSQNVCLPKCENGCGSGRCIAKNKCSCDFGYKWDKSLEKCSLMDCDKECVSPKGKCVHPGKCECNKGYTQSSNKTCIPYCESGCDHGFCVQPNKCRCSAGFKEKNLNGTSVCEPYCDPPCKNSKCVRPNVCECDKGFTKDDRKKNECHCGLHCQEIDMECKCLTEDSRVGGDLIEHDISSLQTVENGTTLSHCLNGFTLNNGTCVCAIGYIMRRNYTDLCEPLCDPECDENGFCDRPNECKCKDGYKLGENEGEGNRCYPECENGFENEINGNFACSASALISEPQTAKSNWYGISILYPFKKFHRQFF